MSHSDNVEATAALARAETRQRAREAARQPIDYSRMQEVFPKQKAELTRALNKADATERRDAVVLACKRVMPVWDEIGAWPDDWARWQRALSDVLPFHATVDMRDLL